MYNSPLIQVLETEHDFRNVILRPFLRKTTKRLDQSSAVTTVEILHDKIEILFTLESKVKFSDKWRFRLVHQDHALSLDIGDLILRNHVRLLQDLDRVVIASDALLSQEDGTKGTLADRLDDLKVLDGRRRRS